MVYRSTSDSKGKAISMTQKAVSLEPSAVSSAAHRLSRLLLTFQILPLPLHREAPEQGGCVCVLKAVDGLVDLQGPSLQFSSFPLSSLAYSWSGSKPLIPRHWEPECSGDPRPGRALVSGCPGDAMFILQNPDEVWLGSL